MSHVPERFNRCTVSESTACGDDCCLLLERERGVLRAPSARSVHTLRCTRWWHCMKCVWITIRQSTTPAGRPDPCGPRRTYAAPVCLERVWAFCRTALSWPLTSAHMREGSCSGCTDLAINLEAAHCYRCAATRLPLRGCEPQNRVSSVGAKRAPVNLEPPTELSRMIPACLTLIIRYHSLGWLLQQWQRKRYPDPICRVHWSERASTAWHAQRRAF